mmetsp:Transcript_52661/g.119117  ORF Transcript_52661/g.119117 Transcript_52661/m.119117 type:complete len:100 (-) Transcript_52661:598-897(-)
MSCDAGDHGDAGSPSETAAEECDNALRDCAEECDDALRNCDDALRNCDGGHGDAETWSETSCDACGHGDAGTWSESDAEKCDDDHAAGPIRPLSMPMPG